MKKPLIALLAAATALTSVTAAGAAAAQPAYHRDSDRDGRPDAREWNRDHDGRPDPYDRHDNRRDSDRDGRADAREWSRDHDRDRDGRPDQYDHHDNRREGYRFYGGSYGYNGYHGRWRAGQRYPHWRDHRYEVENWRAYNLPPPRPGYRYYRDDNGDVVMAAIASGAIGLIIGGALAGH